MAQVKLRRPWFGPDGVLYDAGVQFVPNEFLTREPKEDEDDDKDEGKAGKGKKAKKGKGILPSTAEVLSESDKLTTQEVVVGVPIAPKTVTIVTGASDDKGLLSTDQKRPEDPKVKAAQAEKAAADELKK